MTGNPTCKEPPPKRRTVQFIAAIFLGLLAIVAVQILEHGGWRTSQSLPLPVFKENGNAFMGYIPQIDPGPGFYPATNTLKRGLAPAIIINGRKVPFRATVDEVRDSATGAWTQIGNIIWFAPPGSTDINSPSASVSYSAAVRPKTWLTGLLYSIPALWLFMLGLIVLVERNRAALMKNPYVAGLVAPAGKLAHSVSSFARLEGPVLLAIAAVIAIRVLAFPPLFNFLDTFSMLREPLQIVGHIPPLYLILVASLKAKLGLGPALLNTLMLIQYMLFAGCLYYLCRAFDTTKQRLVVVLAVALNFYVLLIAGGILTESIALPELLVMFGAFLRLVKKRRVEPLDAILFGLSSMSFLCTRHTFIVFAGVLPMFCGLAFLASLLTLKGTEAISRLKPLVLATVFVALSALAGLKLCEAGCRMVGGEYNVPKGRFGVQAMGRFWQRITPDQRIANYDNLAKHTADPLVKATFKTLLSLPNSDQTVYHFPKIYELVQSRVKESGTAGDIARAESLDEIEAAASKATEIFFLNPDKTAAAMFAELFFQYTQVREALLAPNPVYAYSVIRSKDTVDPTGIGWNLPTVKWGYLNRCLLNHHAISEMWCHLCPDTTRLTERVFSPEWKNTVRDGINSRLFWFLDFINPATNLLLLASGLAIGALTRRLSVRALGIGLAVLLTTLCFDVLHALSTQETLSRYLAPASLFLALGNIVVWLEVFGLGLFVTCGSRKNFANSGARTTAHEKIQATTAGRR